MRIDQTMDKIADENKTYSRKDLYQLFLVEKQDLSDSTFRWILYHLLSTHRLYRIGYDTYSVVLPERLTEYHPFYSDKAVKIMRKIANRYPDIAFTVFESILLNEFLNHQIAQNTIFVQVDKEVSSVIFDYLKEELHQRVLYNPTKKEFERYWEKDSVIVLDLISQPPVSLTEAHEITIEKLLVDIVAEKCIAETFSPSELPYIFGEASERYLIDLRKMNRYAGRRNRAAIIRKYIDGSR